MNSRLSLEFNWPVGMFLLLDEAIYTFYLADW